MSILEDRPSTQHNYWHISVCFNLAKDRDKDEEYQNNIRKPRTSVILIKRNA